MLSQHDQRALADIEAHLRNSDPWLARELSGLPEPPPARKRRTGRTGRRAGVAGLILGLTLGLMPLASPLAVHSADAAVSAIIVFAGIAIGTAMCAASRLRRRRR